MLTLLTQQCQGCKSPFLLDEKYQIVCTSCGLCDCTEQIPTVDDVTDLMGTIDFSTKPTAAQLEMVQEDQDNKRKANVTELAASLRITPFKRVWRKAKKKKKNTVA